MAEARATVPLGRSGLRVSRVILGCMFPAKLTEAEATRVVHAAYGSGITSFDTAPLYDFHRAEQWLGRALRDRRQHVQLLTKAGLRWDAAHGRALFSFTDGAGQRRVVRTDSRPQALRDEVLASCRRLGSQQLDLVQLHQPDHDTPIESSVEALSGLQEAGVIRGFGVSNFDAAQLSAACRAGAVASLQSEYSLIVRWPERQLLPLCRRQQLAFLAYAPLAQGALAGASPLREPGPSRASRLQTPLARLALRGALEGPLRELSHGYGVSCAQVALAWLLAQPGVSAVVVGASSAAQAQDVAAALELTLTQRDCAVLGGSFARAQRWLKLAERARRLPVLGRVFA